MSLTSIDLVILVLAVFSLIHSFLMEKLYIILSFIETYIVYLYFAYIISFEVKIANWKKAIVVLLSAIFLTSTQVHYILILLSKIHMFKEKFIPFVYPTVSIAVAWLSIIFSFEFSMFTRVSVEKAVKEIFSS